MAHAENEDAKQESKADDSQSLDQFVSQELGKEILDELCIQPHSSQVEYFVNIYWNTHCKEHKDEIFGIFCKFAEINELTVGIRTNQVSIENVFYWACLNVFKI